MFCREQKLKAVVISYNVNALRPSDFTGNELLDMLTILPDSHLIVLGLQEIVDLESKKNTAKAIFTESIFKEIRPYENEEGLRWDTAINEALKSMKEGYTILEKKQMVGLYLCVVVKQELKPAISDVSIAAVKTGLSGFHGNKGAVAIRFRINDSSFCFVNSHLAAHHSNFIERNADAATILKQPVFPILREEYPHLSLVNGGDGTLILDHEKIFFFGDLNYRVNLSNERVRELSLQKNWAELYKNDQLNPVNNPRNALRHFSEAELTFPPTYKYDVGSHEFDTSEKKRIPAWCDRILWKGKGIKCLRFSRKEYRNSDHRAIYCTFEVSYKIANLVERDSVYSLVRSECARNEALQIVKYKIDKLIKRTNAPKELCVKAINLSKGNLEDATRWLNDPTNWDTVK